MSVVIKCFKKLNFFTNFSNNFNAPYLLFTSFARSRTRSPRFYECISSQWCSLQTHRHRQGGDSSYFVYLLLTSTRPPPRVGTGLERKVTVVQILQILLQALFSQLCRSWCHIDPTGHKLHLLVSSPWSSFKCLALTCNEKDATKFKSPIGSVPHCHD